MLTQDNFTKENIDRLCLLSGNDPSLLEKTVYAFGLLEAISKVGMPFIFKGGTCLMLLLDKPRRLSTDIDIIVEPGTDVEQYIAEAGKIFPFKSQSEDVRKGRNNIEKDITNSHMTRQLMVSHWSYCWIYYLKRIIIAHCLKSQYGMNC